MQKCQSPSPTVGAMTEYHPDKAWKKQTSRNTAHALPARLVAFATFHTRGFSSSLGSTAALIATGRSESVPRRV